MAFIIKDRIKEGTTTTGTGDISLGGAPATFESFQSYMTNGDTTYYAIVHTVSGIDEWEVGLGTWNTGNTLTRTTVLSGSNGTSAVNFSAGTKDIFMTYPAAHAALAGDDVTFDNITVTGTVDGRDVAADGTKLDTVEQNADVTDAVNVAAAGALMKSGGTMTGALILNADPTTALGAATKEYVDTIAAAGIHYHTPVRVESPDSAGNLNATYDNGSSGVGATLTNAGTQEALVIDGVTLNTNDRVLIYSQTNAYENGIYTVTNTGSASTNWVLTRATDADSYGASDPNALGEGDAYFVKEGDTGAGELYVMNTSGVITFGTTAITFTVIAETAVYSAGTGMSLDGTTFSIGQDVGTTANVTFNQVTAAIIGNVTGNVTGDVTGNADTATALATARTIQLSGDVTGSATFDGSANINITAAVQDDSHAHVISNVDGLQAALDGKTPTTRTITAGNGLTGGGDLSANRTIDIDSSYTGFDGRYYTETEADSRFVNVTGDTMTGLLTLGPNSNWSKYLKIGGNADNSDANSGSIGVTNGNLHLDAATGAFTTYLNFYDGTGGIAFGNGASGIVAFMGPDGDLWKGSADNSGSRYFNDAYHPNADKWTTARTLSLSGDASGSVSWDGSANATITVAVANDSHTHDGRYYTETEADSRFVNVTGDTMSGDLTLNSVSATINMGYNGGPHGINFYDDDSSLKWGFYYRTSPDSISFELNGSSNKWQLETNGDVTQAGKVYVDTNQRVFADNYHPNADKWTTARTLSLSGDASGSVSWDGSANATLSVTVANDSHSHSNYITSNANDSMSGILTFTSTNNAFAEYNGSGTAPYFRFKTSGTNNGYIQFESNGNSYFWNDRANQGIRVQSGASGLSWYDGSAYRTVWHASNDGSGSGLDADLLDGQHASAFQPAANELTWIDQATGQYGTIKVDDDRGVTWAGYAIRDDWVFMSNGASEAGIYNDTDNDWAIKFAQNGSTSLQYNGSTRFQTESAGASAPLGLRVGTSGNPHNASALEIAGTTSEKIVLSGANDPYIRWQEGTADRAYIQWSSGQDALLFRNQQTDNFDFMPDASTGAVNLRLRGSDNDTWGSVYATDSQEVGFLDEGGSWAYRIANDSSHEWRISNGVEMTLNTSELNMSGNNINNISNMYVANTIYHYGDTDTYINFGTDLMYIYTGNVPKVTVNNAGVRLGDNGNGYFRPVSGNYGSIEIDGGAHSSWEGYSIGGRAVFMHDNASRLGLFDDVYNHWGFFYDFNGDANLTYAGSIKLQTYSGGVSITGDLNSTSDIRYKKNIETIDSALEKVQSLRGVTFDWDNDAFEEKEHTKKPNFTERATGVIAQDVEKVLPEAVHENKDGFKNVAYGNMVGLLIEAIKEQQEQIDALKTQLNG